MRATDWLKKGKKYLKDSNYRFILNDGLGLYHSMPDAEYLKRKFEVKTGKKLNLDHPVTFNEKLQWLKLFDHQPLYTTLVDKYAVKQYVADRIGAEHIIPTIGIWNTFDEIPFDTLPEQFVLKCTHDSGGLVVCKDKSKLDLADARRRMTASLKRDYYLVHREWPYKNVPRKIIAEQYMVDDSGYELKDYKFYCFNGQVKLLMIASDRLTGKQKHFDYYDRDGQVQHIIWGAVPNSPVPQPLPEKFEEMIALAEKLSQNIPHARVDLYLISGKIYFGEMTFFYASGFDPIQPYEWDVRLGNWISLPERHE